MQVAEEEEDEEDEEGDLSKYKLDVRSEAGARSFVLYSCL